ncbi:MAG: (Fe-S)-binding protein [Syntrophaceae bacterium]|nr:(Fe-S)-binding protein [Syntrophaceae bacterium]
MGFNLAKCNFCGDCLDQCPHSDFTKETAAEEIRKLINNEPTKITKECITCLKCNDICPTGANPFDLILWRIEQEGFQTTEAFRKLVALQEDENVFPSQVLHEGKPGMPTLCTCCFTGFIPNLFEGQLFEDMKHIEGGAYEGQLALNHMGERVPKEFLQKQVNNIAATGAKEVVFFHDDCYEAFGVVALENEIDVPFKCIPMSEYMRNYLKAHPEKIKKKLNRKVAVQMCCSQRLSPWQNDYVSEILEMIGCERMKRTYDYENQLCCQCASAPSKGNDYAEVYRDKNIVDAQQSGADTMVFSCAICCWIFRYKAKDAGMEPYMLINLVREALGEELPVGGAALGDDRPIVQLGEKIITKAVDDFDLNAH